MRRPPHCWHPTGFGLSYGVGGGGADDHRCCCCGKVQQFQRKVTESPVAGHGPFFTTSHTTYDFGDESCPKKVVAGDPCSGCGTPLREGKYGRAEVLYCPAFCGQFGPPKGSDPSFKQRNNSNG